MGKSEAGSGIRFFSKLAVLGLSLSGCLDSGDGGGDALTSVALGETALAGKYILHDYLVEYNDGRKLDTANTDFTGTLEIGSDSGYAQKFRLTADTVDIRGKIGAVRVSGGRRDKGEISVRVMQDGKPQESLQGFEIRGDVLILSVDLTESGYLTGYRETDYYMKEKNPREGDFPNQ